MYEHISACIIAGGKGTRLRPITGELPKPLVPLLGKPIIFYILELLKRHGVSTASIALGVQGSKIIEMLCEYEAIDISFSTEDFPLGTAGAVKHAMMGIEDDFIVISGDAMCDLNLSEAYAHHKANNAAVTIISTRVADPREYGLIDCDSLNKVHGFIEKPSYHNCSCDLASTGIYIMSPNVLKYVDDKTAVDFANDLFPTLLDAGELICCYEDSGYWCDIGDTNSYAQCQQDMLYGKVKCDIDAKRQGDILCKSDTLPDLSGISLGTPLYIGEGVTIGKGSIIGEGTILCDNVTVGYQSDITRSILLDGVYVGNDVNVESAILCQGVRLCDNVTVMEGVVMGSNSIAEKGAIISDNVRVWANKTIPSDMSVTEDIHYGTARTVIVDDDGISGQTNIRLTPELCAKIGSSVGSLRPFGQIAIAYNKENCSNTLYHATVAGITASGATAWDFCECIKSEFEFCIAKSGADFGIYIEGGNITTISLFEKGGLPTCRSTDRKLESCINRGEFKRVIPQRMGSVVDMSGLRKLYEIELLKQCDRPLDANVIVKSADKHERHMMEGILTKLGCNIDGGITISLPQGGIAMYDMETTLTAPMILCLLCLYEFERGEDVHIPETAPRIIDKIAQPFGRTVYRYAQCPCDNKESLTRQKAIAKPFLRDPLMMSIRLLSYMTYKGLSLSGLSKLIPEFEQSSRLVPIDSPPTVILKRLSCDKKRLSEGLMLSANGYNAMVRPMKSGKGIMIFSEVLKNTKSESAVEICDMFESIIKER